MIYYQSNEYHFCPVVANYSTYGKKQRKYAQDRQWWEDFVNRWWHHEGLTFTEVIPTEAQIARLQAVNGAGIGELHNSTAALYVEIGIIQPDEEGNIPEEFANLPQQIDLSNTLVLWGYEQAVTELIQAQIDNYNKTYKTAFESVHTAANYRHDTGYTHQPFCASVWVWNISVWEAARAILADIMMGQRSIVNVEDLLAELPAFQ